MLADTVKMVEERDCNWSSEYGGSSEFSPVSLVSPEASLNTVLKADTQQADSLDLPESPDSSDSPDTLDLSDSPNSLRCWAKMVFRGCS